MRLCNQHIHLALAVCAAALVSGCAHTKIGDVALSPARELPAASRLCLRVSLAPGLQGQEAASKAARKLEAKLLEKYHEAGLSAGIVLGQLKDQAAAFVQVRIVEADPGNTAKRLLVGFGAGRSAFATRTRIQAGPTEPVARDVSQPAHLAFSTMAKDGLKPGVILSGGIATVTGDVSRLAVGAAISTLAELRSGLGRQAERTADVIVEQTHVFYRASHWDWPPSQPETVYSGNIDRPNLACSSKS
ncbi:DUF4410 domain-containing protein [Novosphingobium sp. 1949]|uniref:DUF4410 domain-containing protein n=1 Tax=Novosphingobium organovorum TaxID=2930092 RepID=A0ABT0BF25_9SPHN|nr:DUF4410 domain-containing protein [Novosphingobium organovorum]MCJ2183652.1 DUF4410 domain-containing protein [Novosphingobium organovorum]